MFSNWSEIFKRPQVVKEYVPEGDQQKVSPNLMHTVEYQIFNKNVCLRNEAEEIFLWKSTAVMKQALRSDDQMLQNVPEKKHILLIFRVCFRFVCAILIWVPSKVKNMSSVVFELLISRQLKLIPVWKQMSLTILMLFIICWSTRSLFLQDWLSVFVKRDVSQFPENFHSCHSEFWERLFCS